MNISITYLSWWNFSLAVKMPKFGKQCQPKGVGFKYIVKADLDYYLI